MDAAIKALMGAAKSLVHPIILMILLVPMLIALAIWIGLNLRADGCSCSGC